MSRNKSRNAERARKKRIARMAAAVGRSFRVREDGSFTLDVPPSLVTDDLRKVLEDSYRSCLRETLAKEHGQEKADAMMQKIRMHCRMLSR